MSLTPIEWVLNDDGSLGRSWNPIIGCSRISPGCGGGMLGPNGETGGCYAEELAGVRFAVNPMLPMWHGLAQRKWTCPGDPCRCSGTRSCSCKPEKGKNGSSCRSCGSVLADLGGRWTRVIRFLPERLAEPTRWRKGTKVFVCDMGDLLHEKANPEHIGAVFGVMAGTPKHDYYVLTKRDPRVWFRWVEEQGLPGDALCEILASNIIDVDQLAPGWPLPNVVLGVSVENKQHGLPRIGWLRETPARRKFLSIEPLLEDLGEIDLSGIDMVVVGGESGRRSRPFDLRWALKIRSQCHEQGARFFMKQAGDKVRFDGGLILLKKKKGSDLEELPAQLRERSMLALGGSGIADFSAPRS